MPLTLDMEEDQISATRLAANNFSFLSRGDVFSWDFLTLVG